jgi:hypothetical protein
MNELPHACKALPDDGPPAIAITGDLRIYPILVADWQPGLFSKPLELEGNGIYCLKVTPVQPPEIVREWITCPNCGCPGSVLKIILADAHGQPLAGIALSTAAHSMSVAIFGRHGVMVQTVRRSDITFKGALPSQFSSRNFAAGAVDWT